MEISSIIFCRLKYNKTLEAKSAYPVLKELVPNAGSTLTGALSSGERRGLTP